VVVVAREVAHFSHSIKRPLHAAAYCQIYAFHPRPKEQTESGRSDAAVRVPSKLQWIQPENILEIPDSTNWPEESKT
jgi:hypothetical protein